MRTQTPKEELYNSITHGIGFLLSLIGFALLLIYQDHSSILGIIAICLYGISLSTLYFASTLYHYEKKEVRKNFYRKLDHISIYFLIAGTYSPVVLITLSQSLGWTLFWIVWGFAIIGSIFKIFYTGKFEFLSILLYLVMGWLIVFDFSALREIVDTTGIILLISGGAAYTIGIIFYALHTIKHNHVIWHLFVLFGSIFHYLFIFLKVI